MTIEEKTNRISSIHQQQQQMIENHSAMPVVSCNDATNAIIALKNTFALAQQLFMLEAQKEMVKAIPTHTVLNKKAAN